MTDTSTAGYAKTPLLVTAIFTVVLLEIHPFQDGNGRLSRILMTLLLLSAGYSYLPYSSLESVIEQSKEGYLSRPSPDPGNGEDRCTKLAAMGDVFPSRATTTNEAPG